MRKTESPGGEGSTPRFHLSGNKAKRIRRTLISLKKIFQRNSRK